MSFVILLQPHLSIGGSSPLLIQIHEGLFFSPFQFLMDKSLKWYTHAFVQRVHYKIFIHLDKLNAMLPSGHRK